MLVYEYSCKECIVIHYVEYYKKVQPERLVHSQKLLHNGKKDTLNLKILQQAVSVMKKYLLSVFYLLFISLFISADDVIGRSSVLLRGSTPDGYTTAELTLGSFAADGLRTVYRSDFAVWSADELRQNLQPGDITSKSIENSIRYNRNTALIKISMSELKTVLEELLSHIVLNENEEIDFEASDFGGFPQVSGFSFICDASAPAGTRVVRIFDSRGNELSLKDNEPAYSLAGSVEFLSGVYGTEDYSGRIQPEPELLQRDVITEYIRSFVGEISEPATGRIQILGARQHRLLGDVPPVYILGVVFIIVVLFGSKLKTLAGKIGRGDKSNIYPPN